jgi:hypothetical protein
MNAIKIRITKNKMVNDNKGIKTNKERNGI